MLKSFIHTIILATTLAGAAQATRPLAEQDHQAYMPPLHSHPGNQYYCIAGSVGMPGVQMTGLPGDIVSDASGHYQGLIKRGSQPVVIPMKEGFEFNPKGKIYNHVCSDLIDQNYLCEPATYLISGSIGRADVHLEGFPEPVTTDRYGNFCVVVPHGWQATVTPRKEGLDFTPSEVHFSKVVQDMEHQDFTARFKTVTLSGAIVIDHCPMPGVSISTNFGGGADTTDELGRFYIEVPYGWTGDITPYKKGFSFNPPCLSYRNIKDSVDSIDQASGMAKSPENKSSYAFDIACLSTADHAKPTDTAFVPTRSKTIQNSTQVRDNLRVAAAIVDERLGAFATQTQGMYVKDYGIILRSQVRPAFTFQGVPQAAQPSGSSDHYLSLLKENALKLIACTAHVKILDPNQWVVMTLAMPDTPDRDHTMTLQARKYDVDAFAAHEITLQEFKRRVQTTVQ